MTDTWATCRIGSCQRHAECMYHPCRNDTQPPSPTDDEKCKPTIAELEAILNDPHPHEVYMLPNGEVRARPVNTSGVLPTNDELVEMMCEAMWPHIIRGRYHYQTAQSILALIRPHLEARGIEMAAKECEGWADDALRCGRQAAHDNRIADAAVFRGMARRHADGGKNG